ncbi:MAG: 3'-5' exonuclease, partial [Elusimicrobiota bacterium]|nr:3'-5' exonuclease [Elusimicrobiota bacterium]
PCEYINNSEREHIIGVDLDCETPQNKKALVSEEAFAVARLLKNLIKEKYQVRDPASSVEDPNFIDLRPGHIMLLSPTRTHFGIISSAFEQEGFYVEPDKEKIYAGTLIPRVIEILRAVTRPDDSVAVVAGLRSLLLGVDDEKLLKSALDNISFNLGYLLAKKDNLDESVKVAVEMLGELRNIKKELPPDEFIRKAIDFCGSHIMAAAGDNSSPDVRRLESLKNIISEKISISLSPESALEEAVKELTELKAKNSGIVEKNKIRMMTVHQAKGLEAPVVALMNAGHGRKDSVKNIPLRDENSILIKYSVKTVIDSKSLKLTSAQWEDNVEDEKKQNNAEYERQRYVAATRAKDLLVVPISQKYTDEKFFVAPIAKKLKNLAEGNDKIKIVKSTELIGPESDSEVDKKYITDYNDVPFLPDTENISGDSDRDINSGWEKVQKEKKENLKRMKEKSLTVVAVTEEANKIRKDNNIKRLTSVAASILGRSETFGKEGGVFFHELYEKLLKYSDLAPEKLINYCLAETEYKSDNKAQLIEKSRELIEKWKNSPEFKRITEADKLLVETPFFYKDSEKNIIYTGIIDIMIKESGEWTIIDLKSDMMDDSIENKPEIQKALEPYKFQLEIYKKAVEKITGQTVKETRLLFLDS